jgi:hypothetical protein
VTRCHTPDAMRTSRIRWAVALTSAIAAPDLLPRPAQAAPLRRTPASADSRRHRTQKRDDASQKIDQIENQVMSKAQEIETKVSDRVNQIKAQVDWRHQVEERSLLAVGAALVGGMPLGGIAGKGDRHASSQPSGGAQNSHDCSGVTNVVRKAARQSSLEDSIQNFANSAFCMLGERMREMTDRTSPACSKRSKAPLSPFRARAKRRRPPMPILRARPRQ